MKHTVQFFVVFLVLPAQHLAEIEVDGVQVSTSLECYRECDGGTPKTCYYNFTLEYYAVLGRACQTCSPNRTNAFTSSCQCVLADGTERGLLTANRMFPGPSIQVCQNDKVIVDVKNQIEGAGVTIHWHGIWQTDTPYSDGVPFITQCPISEGATFRYQFIAGNEGTHFWHSHSGLQKLDGLCGTLVVRQPKNNDVSWDLYDEDLAEHVIILNDWLHEYASEHFMGRLSSDLGQTPDNILINGKGQAAEDSERCASKVPLEVFDVEPGKRYRFRLINAFTSVCPAQFAIEGHSLAIIATDGVAVEPDMVHTIISYAGERYDFIIEANRKPSTFWVQVRGLGECGLEKIQQLAVLRYQTSKYSTPPSKIPTYDRGLPQGRILNPPDPRTCTEGGRGLCVNQLQRVERLENLDQEPDTRIYAPFEFEAFESLGLFQRNVYDTVLATYDGALVRSLINKIHFENPPSPLLSQRADLDQSKICNNTLNQCNTSCSCTHIYKVPVNSLVEIILLDSVAVRNLSHPFHLHGGVFQVIASGISAYQNISKINTEHFTIMENDGQVNINVKNPPSKDTIAVPFNGYVILRARVTNPGYWLFHCHFLYHIMVGMSFVLQVGEPTEMTQVPPGFPTCGSFQVPI